MSFFVQYKQLCEKNNISPSAFALSIGVSKTSVTRWKNGVTPNADILKKIADKFQVSTDYLLGNETKENSSPESELSRLILKEVEKCSEAEAKIILEQIKLIKSLRNK